MFRELLRRVCLLGGLFLAIWPCFYAPDGIVRVRRADLLEEYNRSQTPGGGLGVMERGRETVRQLRGPETLEQYIARKTSDRLYTASGSAWQALFNRLKGDSAEYVCGSQPPFDSAGGLFRSIGTFRYVRLPEGFLTASVTAPAEASRAGAPASVVYPHRSLSIWCLGFGLAAYVLVPRMKHVPGALRFGSWSGVFVPDFLGVVLAALFFALPLLIVPDFTNCTSRELFTADHIWFFVFLWPFSLGGLFILLYAARYASLQIVVTPDGFQWMTPGSTIEVPFSQVSRIEEFEQRTPRWLALLGILVSFLNWRAVPHAANLRRYRRLGLDIHTADGRRFRLWQDMPGFERMSEALAAAGHMLSNF